MNDDELDFASYFTNQTYNDTNKYNYNKYYISETDLLLPWPEPSFKINLTRKNLSLKYTAIYTCQV